MHRLTSICVRRPWLTLLVVAVALAAAGISAARNQRTVGTEAILGSEHPTVRRFEEFLDRFGGGYPVLIAYECARPDTCRSALDPAALEMAYAVSHQLEQSRFVSRVSSPANTPVLLASEELGIEARRLVVDGAAVADPALPRLALADPLWRRTLVSVDGRVGAIVVELTSTESEPMMSAMAEIGRALAPFQERDFHFHLVGEAVLWVAAHEDSVSSMMRISVGTGGMLFLTLLFLLRSLPAVVASLATIGVASAWTLGLLPLLGWRLSELTSGAATLILVIGCADCVHLVAHYLETRARFPDDASALEAASRHVLAPCFLTTATSAGSFASFGWGGLHSLVHCGVTAAIGVSLAFLLTFTLLPALLVLLPAKPRSRRHSAVWQDVLARLADVGARRSRVVLGVAAVLAVLGALGIHKLRVDLSFSALWGPEHRVRRALDFVSDHLQRPGRVEIEIVPPETLHAEDPAVVGKLVEVGARLASLEGIGEPRSIATLLLRANHLLRPDAPESALPSSEAVVGELLTLVSAGGPGAVDAWLTLDQRAFRISAEVGKLDMAQQRRLLGQVEDALERMLPSDWTSFVTGPVTLGTEYGEEFGRSQTTIISASSLIVFVFIGLYLRSFAWAVLAMIPNAVALLLLFGAMGHWGIHLDFGSAIVAPIAIGIAADDTIHFLTAYARERRSGLDPIGALRRAISSVGEAVIATSIALAFGFLSCMTSPFPSISSLGLLSAIAIIAATLADLIVLPALIATVAAVRPLSAFRTPRIDSARRTRGGL